jgi:phage head maturation protease
MRAGAIDGLSIGYECHDWEMQQSQAEPHPPGPYGCPANGPGVRVLKTINLWEVSVVTFPMNADARIDAVRATGAVPSSAYAAEIATLLGAVISRGRLLRETCP